VIVELLVCRSPEKTIELVFTRIASPIIKSSSAHQSLTYAVMRWFRAEHNTDDGSGPIATLTSNRLRVGISLLYYSQRLTGAGTYVRGLTHALVSRNRHDYVLFLPEDAADYWHVQLRGLAFDTCVIRIPSRSRLRRDAIEHLWLGAKARRAHLDAVFFPHTVAPWWRAPFSIPTVYDLAMFSQDSGIGVAKRLYHRALTRLAQTRSAGIVTISDFCRKEIAERHWGPKDRIFVAPPGIDADLLRQPRRLPQRLDLSGRYILSVAAAYPYKRLELILDVYESLADLEPDLQMVFGGLTAGRADILGRIKRRAVSRGQRGRVRFLPEVSRDELAALYSNASAYISASIFEGFGIPVAEAMASGCPVAASPAEAVVETTAGHAWLAVDHTAEALRAQVIEALEARASNPAKLELAQAHIGKTYTWERSASAIESAITKLAANSR
jgi:glycosyltransferase involved in cell wall biosynthesis